jgi:hypothetical protein
MTKRKKNHLNNKIISSANYKYASDFSLPVFYWIEMIWNRYGLDSNLDLNK